MLPCLEPHELHQLQMGTINRDGAELCSPKAAFPGAHAELLQMAVCLRGSTAERVGRESSPPGTK